MLLTERWSFSRSCIGTISIALGTEGGPENQAPSKDPALEVVIIEAILRMVQPCDVIVHGHGRFSNAIHDAMTVSFDCE